MSSGVQLLEIPLVGYTKDQGADSGQGSFVLGAQNTAQNEWTPAGALAEAPSEYNLSTLSTQLPTGTFKSPDLCFFENRNEIFCLDFEKCYSISSDNYTLALPSTPEENIFNNLGSARSWQTPIETVTLKSADYGTQNPPSTFLYSLDCFCSYSYKLYYNQSAEQTLSWGLSFFDKNTGKKWGEQPVFFLTEEYDSYSRSSLNILQKQFITESSAGKIGVLGYYTGGSNPNRVQEYSIQVARNDLPDLSRTYKSADYDPSGNAGYIAPFDGNLIGYDKIVADDGNSIIDIIAVIGEISGIPTLSITSRIERSVVSSLSMSPTVANPFTAEGSVYISDLPTGECVVCWSFVETSGANTGVSYRKLILDRSTGALSFDGAEVLLYSDVKTSGIFINCFCSRDLRETSTFKECIVANREMQPSGNIATYKYNESVPGQAFSQDTTLFGLLFNSQPVKIQNMFMAIGSFQNGPSLEFGQCAVGFYNWDTQFNFYTTKNLSIKPLGVLGYNETWGASYAQTGFCQDSYMLFSMCSDEVSLFARSTQVGACESLRPVKFNGEVYLFSGFQYIANPKTGLERVGSYTSPRLSVSSSGAGTFSGTFDFRACYFSFGGEGIPSEVAQVVAVNATTLTFSIQAIFLDLFSNSQFFSALIDKYFALYGLDSSDGLYKKIENTISSASISSQGTLSFDVDVSSGALSFGYVAQFESGEAPQVGLSSPRLATLSLGRLVCSDEFSEKIYTSKEQSESNAAEFSDVLFINASPSSEPVREIAELNNSMVVFSDRSIYAITGTLPDSFGNQSLSEWQLVSNSLGANTSAPTIVTDSGVYFGSSDGIYLLNKGFQLQEVTSSRVQTTYPQAHESQTFWWKSDAQDSSDNIIFSTSSLRSYVSDESLQIESNSSVLNSAFLFNEKFQTLSNVLPFPKDSLETYNIYAVSGIFGGIFAKSTQTLFFKTFEQSPDNSVPALYDTGYFCPFGQYSYGQVVSVYFKFKLPLRSSPGTYPVNLVPYCEIYSRDDYTNFEIHQSTQSMEEPVPSSDSRTFVWRVRTTIKRVNALRIVVECGYWSLAGISVEAIPQNVGGVKRQLQGVT